MRLLRNEEWNHRRSASSYMETLTRATILLLPTAFIGQSASPLVTWSTEEAASECSSASQSSITSFGVAGLCGNTWRTDEARINKLCRPDAAVSDCPPTLCTSHLHFIQQDTKTRRNHVIGFGAAWAERRRRGGGRRYDWSEALNWFVKQNKTKHRTSNVFSLQCLGRGSDDFHVWVKLENNGTDYLAVKIKVQPVFVVQQNLLIMRITEYLHLHLQTRVGV